MTDKLDKIKERFEFLNGELSKAEVCADPERCGKYSKERADLAKKRRKPTKNISPRKRK